MGYTILQLSRLSGVSTRTIRYYEEVGLLKPAGRTDSGYRTFTDKEVDVLWQILFYRRLGMKLSDIKSTMQERESDRKEALKEHLKELMCQRSELDRLIETVRKTILMEEGKITMTDQEKFEGLKKELIQKNEKEYGEEIRDKYGKDTVEKSNAKMMNLTVEEYEEMQILAAELDGLLKEAVISGASPKEEKGKQAYQLHRKWLSYTWPSYTKEAHMGLTEMYLADERFKEYYDKEVEGCALFLRDAVVNFA